MALARRTFIIERRSDGPTPERLRIASGHYHVGDDKQGTRIYHFHDSTLDRLYSRLTKRAGRYQDEQLRSGIRCAAKIRHHWFAGGLNARWVRPTSTGYLHRMIQAQCQAWQRPKQAHHRQQYRAARERKSATSPASLWITLCAPKPRWRLPAGRLATIRGRRRATRRSRYCGSAGRSWRSSGGLVDVRVAFKRMSARYSAYARACCLGQCLAAVDFRGDDSRACGEIWVQGKIMRNAYFIRLTCI
jgi:hypothetical protein